MKIDLVDAEDMPFTRYTCRGILHHSKFGVPMSLRVKLVTRHVHDVRAMSACAPTPDVSLRRTNRRNGPNSCLPHRGKKNGRLFVVWPRRSQSQTCRLGRDILCNYLLRKMILWGRTE